MQETSDNMPIISCFISASAHKNDKGIVAWFSTFLEKIEINPVFATHHFEPRPPKDKIMDLIQNSDIFLAVLTKRDKIEGKDIWIGPEWVQNEIAIAHTMNKPIAIFVEDKVQIEKSIGPLVSDYIRFKREDMDDITDKAEKFIKSLCKNIDVQKYSNNKKIKINDTIMEDVEESGIEEISKYIGKKMMLSIYGRLDVNLNKYYLVIILLLIIPSYFVYDYIWGNKIVGSMGGGISIVLIILMIYLLTLPKETKCEQCNSHFSERQKSITYGDLKQFPDLPQNRKLVKFYCEVCGNTRFETIERY